jgi:hypothetical protein
MRPCLVKAKNSLLSQDQENADKCGDSRLHISFDIRCTADLMYLNDMVCSSFFVSVNLHQKNSYYYSDPFSGIDKEY